MNNSNTSTFVFKTQKKNSYVKLEEGSYPRRFQEQVERAITALATDDLRSTKMVRHNKRSGTYDVTMGFDKRNWWFENNYIPKGHVAPFATVEEAIEALREILRAARAGEFDEALEELLIQRQEHASDMLKSKKVCGFHALPAPEPLIQLEAPMKHLPASEAVPS